MFSLVPEITDKITVVHWADASQSGEWKFESELRPHLEESITIIESIGFLIHEDDEKIVMAACMCPTQGTTEAQCGRRVTIPKVNIRRRYEVDLGVYKR